MSGAGPELATSRDRAQRIRIEQANPANDIAAGHNGGPPLEDAHRPEWVDGGIGKLLLLEAAHRRAWHQFRIRIVAFAVQSRTGLGLTYEEYTLEILDAAVTSSRRCRTDCRDQAGPRGQERG